MQRVAIARALVNDPDIILADEPTGALDSKTSIQIMNILREIAKNKLVVMVTHNPELAKTYSSRIITVKDGRVVGDTNPFKGITSSNSNSRLGHTSMSLLTAINLSKNNLMTKRGRTLLTAIAGSIGIITYISVLERTKEIGILRAIGASRRDVARVFRAETIIEGLIAGLLGVGVSWVLCSLISIIVSLVGKIDHIASLSPLHAVILIVVSVVLTVFAGENPARRASKKDPVEALRSE